MPDYTLTVEGPHPMTRHITADDDDGAVLLARHSVEADYGDEGDPAVLQANVTLSSPDGAPFDGTIAQMLGRKA